MRNRTHRLAGNPSWQILYLLNVFGYHMWKRPFAFLALISEYCMLATHNCRNFGPKFHGRIFWDNIFYFPFRIIFVCADKTSTGGRCTLFAELGTRFFYPRACAPGRTPSRLRFYALYRALNFALSCSPALNFCAFVLLISRAPCFSHSYYRAPGFLSRSCVLNI